MPASAAVCAPMTFVPTITKHTTGVQRSMGREDRDSGNIFYKIFSRIDSSLGEGYIIESKTGF